MFQSFKIRLKGSYLVCGFVGKLSRMNFMICEVKFRRCWTKLLVRFNILRKKDIKFMHHLNFSNEMDKWSIYHFRKINYYNIVLTYGHKNTFQLKGNYIIIYASVEFWVFLWYICSFFIIAKRFAIGSRWIKIAPKIIDTPIM